jgi:hypothetical protein
MASGARLRPARNRRLSTFNHQAPQGDRRLACAAAARMGAVRCSPPHLRLLFHPHRRRRHHHHHHTTATLTSTTGRYCMRRAILAAENEGEPTERLLWHGTPVPHVIIKEGFDPRVCNLQGMFGAGVYFADKSTKSVRYAGACAEGPVFSTPRTRRSAPHLMGPQHPPPPPPAHLPGQEPAGRHGHAASLPRQPRPADAQMAAAAQHPPAARPVPPLQLGALSAVEERRQVPLGLRQF